MAKILISYGDVRYLESLRRVERMAKKMGYFDKIIMYTDKDLPLSIKSSPCFIFSKGGGYWVWKSYIVWNTLLNSVENDVVYYVDAGCGLNSASNEWNMFDKLLVSNSAIFFQYREDAKDCYPEWASKCTTQESFSSHIKFWAKPSTVEFFRPYFKNNLFLEYNSLWCGAFIIKNNNEGRKLIKEWMQITLFNPFLSIDPFGLELLNIPSSFNAHRHDQSILTLLVCYYKEFMNLAILPETSESKKDIAAIRAERFIQAKMNFWQYIKYRVYILLKGDVDDSLII